MATNPNLYEALQCPICDSLYVESLWSLFSHIAQSHETFPVSALTFESLEKMKKFAPKSKVSIVRPAFSENGDPSVYLSSLMPLHSEKVNSSLDAEIAESGGFVPEQKEWKVPFASRNDERSQLPIEVKYYICIQCGEQIGDSASIAAHKAKHIGEQPSSAEETAISTLVALSNDLQAFKPSDPPAMTPGTTPTASLHSQSPPVAEETDLPSVASFKMKQISNRLNAPRPRRSPALTQAKASALTCSHCGQMFQNKCKLTRHLMDHKLARNPYRCPYRDCLQSYEFKNKFKSHLLRQHKNLSAAEFTRLIEQGDKESERLKKLDKKLETTISTVANGILQSTLNHVNVLVKENSSPMSYGTIADPKEEDIGKDEMDLDCSG